MVNIAIGTDTPNYCLHHSCPACNYKLQDEPELYPTHLIAMDGNNLAKRLLSAGRADDRDFDSNYFLTREEVDHFKDEVKSCRKTTDEILEEDDAPWIIQEKPKDQFKQNGRPAPCTDSWKASAVEHQQTAKAIYDSTGIFPAACQHGIIIKACEMVQSGELYVMLCSGYNSYDIIYLQAKILPSSIGHRDEEIWQLSAIDFDNSGLLSRFSSSFQT